MNLIEHVETIFSPAGPIAASPGYEHRPQQAAMASAVASALLARSHLIVEAPTGVGKTLAYLIPTLLYSLQEGRKAIVSTHTKNLQEQLIRKDIPLACALLGRDIAVTALKGRRNYLCTTRLEHAIDSPSFFVDDQGRGELARIREWSLRTIDGDVEGLGFVPRSDIWDSVCSEQGICSSATCSGGCFFQRAKIRAREANLLIVNHALFFSLLSFAEREDGFIFPDDFVIFDEAHTLEAVAGAGIGLRLSERNALLAVHRFFHPKTKKGLLAGSSTRSAGRKKIAALCEKADQAIEDLFASAGTAARALASHTDRGARRQIRIRTILGISNDVDGPLGALEAHVRDVEENTDDLFKKQELAASRQSLREFRDGVTSFLEQWEADLTYWIDVTSPRNIQLCAAPSDVGEVLGARLFRDDTSVILTSATLSVNNSLDYFRSRIGGMQAEPLILDTPFDHARQMSISIARGIPEPEAEGYAHELPGWIMRSVERTHGRALVLFTSDASMRSTAAVMAGEFASRGFRLLVQNVDGPPPRLLEEFRKDVDSVLFGLDSFWMGIDVPGEALQHVIITRLPFAVPTHPLIEARLEAIAARGGNSFFEFTLPEAILKLKQGVGRLIRTQDDTGIVTLLDSRLLTKSYGKHFVASLPRCPIEILDANGDTEQIEPREP